MSWQERLRDLGDRLAEGRITTGDYRRLSEEILAEADAEAAAATQPTDTQAADTQAADTQAADTQAAQTQSADTQPADARAKVHIPVSAAWEAPSGEMTQIVGTQDKTTVVDASIADKLEPDDPQT